MDCSPGQNKVAAVERWLLVEVPLYSVETISIMYFTVIISNLLINLHRDYYF